MADAPVSSSTQKRRDIDEAVQTAMHRYKTENDAVVAKTARLRALREAHEAEGANKKKP